MSTESNNKQKDVMRVRGTASFFSDNTFEFVSQKEGSPKRTEVRKVGSASTYLTTGKEPKRVVTLECRGDEPDPAARLTSQFADMMKAQFEAKLPESLKPKGIQLVKRDDMTMAVNKTKKRLEVSFYIDLQPEGVRDYKTKFYEKIQEISKCFAINETTIRKSK